MKQIKGVLLDLDGTLYFNRQQIPGAGETIDRLRNYGYSLRFLTNTDSRKVDTLYKGLNEIGLSVEYNEIYTPVIASFNYLRTSDYNNVFTLVSNELYDCYNDFRKNDSKVDYVVVGNFRDRFEYSLINEAFRHINKGAKILALKKSRYFYSDKDTKNLDTGSFVKLLEYATGKDAIVLGKPGHEFFMTAIKSMKLKPEEVVVVGDDLETDIKGAIDIGATSVLVRTGKGNKSFTSSAIQPDYIIDDITELPSIIT